MSVRDVALAPLRCLALVSLSLVGVVAAEVSGVLIALIVPYPWLVALNRRLAQLGRRWSTRWAGVPIAVTYRPVPTEPVRRDDGWYVFDNQLYRRPGVPRFLRRVKALGEDPASLRDWLWLAFTPFTGGLAVAVPVVLIAGGIALAGSGPAPLTVLAALVAVAAGFALAPLTLRVYGHWSRELLGPRDESSWHRSGGGSWLIREWKTLWSGLALGALAIGSFGFGLIIVVAGVVSWGGLLPQTMRLARPYIDRYRRELAQRTSTTVDSPYRPEPPPPRPDADGTYRIGRVLYRDPASARRAHRYWAVLRDPASWRDLVWMFTAPLLGPLSLGLGVVAAIAFFGLVWQPLWWAPWAVPIGLLQGVWVTPWYLWYGLTLVVPAAAVLPPWLSPVLGLAVTVVTIVLAGPVMRLRLAWDVFLLGPTRSAVLARRVHQLTESRADATDAQAAEVRRIERDLHDGAQARLVAVGLSLATVERLMESDPAAARAVLAQARETSATALTELRDLVRGIHPPVLAERGLGDAVRAVALDYPLPVTVEVDLPGRPPAPIESAAYFALCEGLANAFRHAGPSRIDVVIRYTDGVLRLSVTDDGRGGADPDTGTGLRGIGRRLATFDGRLEVRSPTGGPTELLMEVPCALSSPRTSTS